MVTQPTTDVWSNVLTDLRSQMTQAVFDANLAGSKARINSHGLVVTLPSEHIRERLTHQAIGDQVRRMVKSHYGPDIDIEFVTCEQLDPVELPSDRDIQQVENYNGKFQVRDRRGGNRYFIDNIFLRSGYGAKVGPYGIAIYNALALHTDAEHQEAWPSYETLAILTGMTRRYAIKKFKELEALNIISVERRKAPNGNNSPNVTTLIHPDFWGGI
jgi:hypothetical protein